MEDLKLAVLIDADNISPKYVKVILDEAASFGIAAVKRIYGDWSDPRLKSWRDVLLNNLHHPDAAVLLHLGQKRDRFGHDHRRDGPALCGQPRRFLHRLVGQRFHPPRRPPARSGQAGHRHGRKPKRSAPSSRGPATSSSTLTSSSATRTRTPPPTRPTRPKPPPWPRPGTTRPSTAIRSPGSCAA